MGALVVASGNGWPSKPEEPIGPRAGHGAWQAIYPRAAPDHGMAWHDMAWPQERLGARAEAHRLFRA